MVCLNNSASNERLAMSMVKDALFNEESRKREMATIDQSESQALVSQESQERGRGITGVPIKDNCGHSREAALLSAFTATRRGISRRLVQSIKHGISL